eukprot:scaffold173889_cov26-Tisochrysis_lutea.AAC.2
MREAELKHGRMAQLAWAVRMPALRLSSDSAACVVAESCPCVCMLIISSAHSPLPSTLASVSSPHLQGYVAVDLGLRFPGEKYAGLTSLSAHDATVGYELFL